MTKTAQLIVKTCPRRDLELERVKDFLRANGYIVKKDIESRQWRRIPKEQTEMDADLVLLSTCAFSEVTEKASFHDLQMTMNRIRPNAMLAVCGCLPDINPEALAQQFSGCSFGPLHYEALNSLIGAKKTIEEFPIGNDIVRAGEGVFKIQIQEGCPCRCSYCAINKTIGSLRSRAIDEVMSNFKIGLKEGHKDFALLGDCSGAFGKDRKESLGQLLSDIALLDEEFTLSLADIAPFFLSGAFGPIKKLAQNGRLKSISVAVQSASPRILRLMHRSCDMNLVKKMLLEISAASPKLEKITSIIVGFPSETQEELEQTLQFCREVGFQHVYCHGYSERPGVESASISGKLSSKEITKRLEFARKYLGEQVGCVTDPSEIDVYVKGETK